ncbi:MAG: heavy-metal-associated domain-containing protein [Bacillota bacterium]|nr:heavy-metal-associated domain-containing protein [Bacillota bacterium]
MTLLKVPDMHCGKCVERISKALQGEGLDFTVTLEEHSVEIRGDQAAVEKAIAAMDDCGFSVEPI